MVTFRLPALYSFIVIATARAFAYISHMKSRPPAIKGNEQFTKRWAKVFVVKLAAILGAVLSFVSHVE